MRSKSNTFSSKDTEGALHIQKAKQKGIQHTPQNLEYTNSLFNSQTTTATNYSIRSDAHSLTVQKQDKLALNPFDDKRISLNPTQSLPRNLHIQSGY